MFRCCSQVALNDRIKNTIKLKKFAFYPQSASYLGMSSAVHSLGFTRLLLLGCLSLNNIGSSLLVWWCKIPQLPPPGQAFHLPTPNDLPPPPPFQFRANFSYLDFRRSLSPRKTNRWEQKYCCRQCFFSATHVSIVLSICQSIVNQQIKSVYWAISVYSS